MLDDTGVYHPRDESGGGGAGDSAVGSNSRTLGGTVFGTVFSTVFGIVFGTVFGIVFGTVFGTVFGMVFGAVLRSKNPSLGTS